MSKTQLFLLSLLVCLPLALLAWLGSRLARSERTLVRQQLQVLLADQLAETNRVLANRLTSLQAELLTATDLPSLEPDDLRNFVRTNPLICQLFVLDTDGHLLHPSPDLPLNQGEREFLSRAKMFLLDRDLVRLASQPADQSTTESGNTLATTNVAKETHGWYVWYWGRGLHLIFWRRRPDGCIVGVDLERSRWIAELISVLPETQHATDSSPTQIRLVDSQDQTVYQWGALEPADAEPLVEVPLRPPLNAWRLKYFLADEQFHVFGGRGTYFNLVSGLIAAACGIVGLAVYFYRESSRQAREAATRVNFVNQVSHELKTPLTNIRMYADLLDTDLQMLEDDAAAPARQRLDVIVAECGRLSRMIGNVLRFARQQRQAETLHVQPVQPDEVIRDVCRQFAPTFAQRKIDVELDLAANTDALLDRDVVEQILVNLVGNVEKYAVAGGWMRVSSRQDGERTTIMVADHGPGIPPAARERIFQPFVRLDERLEGVAGTGIGLSIARHLARLHGGDVRLLPCDRGALFQVQLQAPPAPHTEAET